MHYGRNYRNDLTARCAGGITDTSRKVKYPDLRPLLWVLRENIKILLFVYALQYGVKLTIPGFVNAPEWLPKFIR